MCSCFGRRAVAVALEQPVLVVVASELADAGTELLERVEALDPEHLLLECLDELLRLEDFDWSAELGPAVNLPLDAERWAEVATCGFTFSDQAGWLREQYSEAGAELAARAEATDVRSWEQVVSAIPSDTPLPEAVVGAIVGKMRTVQRDDDVLFLPYIGQRLVESGQVDALHALIAADERFATALQPTLAAAGDTDATRGLLERLQDDLAAGRSTHHLELEWLNGAHDGQLLEPLFACLSAALSRPADDPFGAVPSLISAIRRIGGVEAVRRYDDLIASSEESPSSSCRRSEAARAAAGRTPTAS